MASKGLQSAGAGAVLGFGKGLEQDKSIGGAVKEGSITGLAMGIVGVGIGGVSEFAKLLTSSGVQESIVNRTLGIPKKVIERGKSPAPRILAEGTIRTKKAILNKSFHTIESTNNEIGKLLKGNKNLVNTSEVVGAIRDKLQQTYGLVLSPNEIDDIVLKLPLNEVIEKPQITMESLNAIRKTIDNNYIGNGKWLNNSTAESITALKTAANVMRNMVKTSNRATEPLFAQLADSITTKNALSSNLAKPHVMTMLLEGIGSTLAGAATGGFGPEGIVKAGAYFALLKGILSTPAQLGLAQTLKTGSKIGSSAITKGVGQIGKIGINQAIKNIAK